MHEEMKTIEAGGYTLVAKFHKGAHRGVVWSGGKIVDEVQGETLEAVWRALCDRLYERQVALAAARGGKEPSSEEAAKALLRISPRLHTGHKKMLRAHRKMEGQLITATQLAEAAGYSSYSAANLQYGLLGAMLFAEMPENLPKRADGSPIMTCAIASEADHRSAGEEQWVWKMRPHIVEALDAAAIL